MFFLLFAFAQLFPLKIKNQNINIELAVTDEQRSKGLMFRTHLPEYQGMLFVFEQEQTLSFWMKNTLIPLSIGYFNKEGILIDIQEMQPQAKEKGEYKSYPSRQKAKYALEMNAKWFENNKIPLGTRLDLKGLGKALPK